MKAAIKKLSRRIVSPNEDWIGRDEVAEILQISRWAVQRLVDSGVLEPAQVTGRVKWYDRVIVLRLAVDRTRQALFAAYQENERLQSRLARLAPTDASDPSEDASSNESAPRTVSDQCATSLPGSSEPTADHSPPHAEKPKRIFPAEWLDDRYKTLDQLDEERRRKQQQISPRGARSGKNRKPPH